MSTCTTCSAEFGPKFGRLVCAKCQKPFCAGHLVPSENASFHSKLMSTLHNGHGLCLECILQIWGKTDEDLKPPKGIVGRTKNNLNSAWSSLGSVVSRTPNRKQLVKIYDSTFESLNSSRAFAVFRHQKEITQDFIIKDLTTFARLYAVSQGRTTEKNFNLTDIYHLIDWLRSHPRIPNWAHGVTWSRLESSPAYFSQLSDVWHVAQTAILLSNPASATTYLVYHVGDRAMDQQIGKGLLSVGYDVAKDKLGLNINPKKALLCYLAGLFIIQLLQKR